MMRHFHRGYQAFFWLASTASLCGAAEPSAPFLSAATILEIADDSRWIESIALETPAGPPPTHGPLAGLPRQTYLLQVRVNSSELAPAELYVYGDVLTPAALEIRLGGSAAHEPRQRAQAIALLSHMLADAGDAAVRRELLLAAGDVDTGDWVIEYTAPELPSDTSGWWVSVYSREAVDTARLKQQTSQRNSPRRILALRPARLERSSN